MEQHGFTPRAIHSFDFFRAVTLVGKKGLDRVVDDGGEGNHITEGNLRRRGRAVGLVLL